VGGAHVSQAHLPPPLSRARLSQPSGSHALLVFTLHACFTFVYEITDAARWKQVRNIREG